MLGAAPPNDGEGGGRRQGEGASSVPEYLKFFAASDSRGDNSTAKAAATTASDGQEVYAPLNESIPPPGGSNRDTRLKKRPKGDRWRPSLLGDGSGPKLRDETNAWWRRTDQCLELDGVCHRTSGNRWFYFSDDDRQGVTFQPDFELKGAPAKYDGGKDRADESISIKLSSPADGVDPGVPEGCGVSPVKRHVVLQSLFNDMIGEFYSRTLLRLYKLMAGHVEREGRKRSKSTAFANSTTPETLLPWEEQIQFYVHVAYGNKRMLDGHALLLSGMLSDPSSPEPMSLRDVFVEQDGDKDECKCYEKMVFCGYDVYTHTALVDSADIGEGSGNNPADTTGHGSNGDDDEVSKRLKYTLWSSMKLDVNMETDHTACGRGGLIGDEYACEDWGVLRTFLGENFARHYPTLESDVAERRARVIRDVASAFGDGGNSSSLGDVAIVGLTQRTYRRSWINLPKVLAECNARLTGRAVCVEVNVENARTPYEQLLMHRSLDALVGVHGAQLTQSVLLPPGGHVLELLPWVPQYIRGRWVQTTHAPTPLGIIFHNSDLNHLGYSLGRDSIPLCEKFGEGSAEEEACFLGNRKRFIWENRDFAVDPGAVVYYVERFVLYHRARRRTCDDLEIAIDGGRFVLYNVHCLRRRRWHTHRDPQTGSAGCTFDARYPSVLERMGLVFDDREACCSFHGAVCEGDGSGGGVISGAEGREFVVYHGYHNKSEVGAA
ncbi:hypothetical protein THAOC_16495 [Thalassiosira oceanica]|uniref:Uncharacterized protein n=1 Tax=Thalassiosira oceanica TaxID=159749 RepID=K0S9P9_THAOC|nr:hypothetical protein THAOC_16495 [Thalassiosira oceanica]|eukprot:EJK62878.1 hypothetical protein THAOC_16495 [Thalassiosira oceanica]